MSRADGVSEEELANLHEYARARHFTDRERAALAYADAITAGGSVPDELYERVCDHFTEDEIIELTATAVWELAAAKFNRALQIEAQGICLLPPKALP